MIMEGVGVSARRGQSAHLWGPGEQSSSTNENAQTAEPGAEEGGGDGGRGGGRDVWGQVWTVEGDSGKTDQNGKAPSWKW